MVVEICIIYYIKINYIFRPFSLAIFRLVIETKLNKQLHLTCVGCIQWGGKMWACFVNKITLPTREHERPPIFTNSHLHNSPRSVICHKVCGPFILDAGSCKICGGLQV